MATIQVLNAQTQVKWSPEVVTFPDGKEKEILLYYDAFKEWLNYKDELGEERRFHSEDVVSFDYLEAVTILFPLIMASCLSLRWGTKGLTPLY